MNLDLSIREVEEILSCTGLSHKLRERLELTVNFNDRFKQAVLLERGWERHHKRNRQVYQVVLQTLLGKWESIDWAKFAENHEKFCYYWDRHGWQYCPETLIDWIDNGMNPPPPEAESAYARRQREMADRF